MADAISIQELIDARTDAKTLEEAVNGDAVTTVLSRLGESYPTLANALSQIDGKLDSADAQVKQGITNLFENGGLPATPFATKSLMTASALVDGEYAQVTEDTVNNGLYIKQSGVWVKSGYDSLDRITNIEKDLLMVEKNYSIAPVTFKGGIALSNSTGLEVANVVWQSSNEYVPVKAGDFVVLKNLKRREGHFSSDTAFTHFAIYGTDKSFKYSSGVLNTAPELSSEKDNRLLADPYLDLESGARYNTGIKITEDGFIKVSCIATLPTDKNVEVLVVNKNKFMELVLGIHDKQAYSDFLDVSVQAQPSQYASGKGFVVSTAQVVGAKTVLTADAYSNVTQAVPVTKGQFITVQGHKDNRDLALLILEDSQGNFLQVVDVYDAYNLVNHNTTRTILNYEVPFDCFARFSYSVRSSVPFMYAVHNSKFNVTYPYLDSETKINFFESGSLRAAGHNLTMPQVSNASWGHYSRLADTATSHSVAYTLKKGEVLEYQLDSTGSPFMALVTGHRDFRTERVSDKTGSIITLTDNTLATLEVQDLLLADPSSTKKTHYVNGSKGVVYYCNDESDSTVVFFRPRKAHTDFDTFALSEAYNLNVLTKEEYKAKRDEFLHERISKLSSMRDSQRIADSPTSPWLLSIGSSGSVLMFEGEVLRSYVGGQFGYVTQYLSKNTLGETTKNVDTSGAFSNAISDGYARVPMSDTDPRSGKYVDILVKTTSVVYSTFKTKVEEDLSSHLVDAEYFKNKQKLAAIYHLDKDMPINMHSAYGYFLSGPDPLSEGSLKYSLFGNEDTFHAFVPKGSYIKVTSLVQMLPHSGYIIPLKDATGKYVDSVNNMKPVFSEATAVPIFSNFRWADGERYVSMYKYPSSVVVYVEQDSLVLFRHTKRTTGAGIYTVSNPEEGLSGIFEYTNKFTDPFSVVLNNLISKNYKPKIEVISKEEYESDYKVTSKNFIHIPETSGLTFNFLEVVGISLTTVNYGVLQIKQNGSVVAVLAVKTENQGQSSSSLSRKNINVEFLNDKGDDVFIKFGDNPEEAEMVIKSYLYTDKGNFKDSTCADIWHEIRNQSPTRVGGAFPDYVFNDLSQPYNQVARGTTFGFPVLVEFNGSLYSTATIRSKKKRANYCMIKKNREHILLQIDYRLGDFSWVTAELSNYELRNPSISGYEEGDATLPAGNEDVADAVNRFLYYARDCLTGAKDLASTYQDYINLDSFIDYAICVNLIDNPDGITNNYLIGTHDATLWSVYQYDTDQTLGGRSGTKTNPYSLTLFGNNFFAKVAAVFPDEVARRYKYLRDTGIIEGNRYKRMIKGMVNTIPVEAQKVSEVNWGGIFESSGAPHSMDWIVKRISHLDLVYNYLPLDEEVYVYSSFSTGSVTADSDKVFEFTGTKAIPDVALLVDIPNLPIGLTASAVCEEVGKIKLTITNNTSATLASSSTTLKIKRGV